MTKENQEKVLRFMLRKTGRARINVRGISMLPALREGYDLEIENSDKYDVGDILVYNYNGEGLLVHRLLKKDDMFVCKGDNAFRFEKIGQDEVIGKVMSINGKMVKKWEAWKIGLSFEIGNIFCKLKNLECVMRSSLYRLYSTLVLEQQLDSNVFCLEIYESILFENGQFKCVCHLPEGGVKEYRGIDGVIIFCAVREKSIQTFLDDVFGYFTNIDCFQKDEVYFRLCALINNQTIAIK